LPAQQVFSREVLCLNYALSFNLPGFELLDNLTLVDVPIPVSAGFEHREGVMGVRIPLRPLFYSAGIFFHQFDVFNAGSAGLVRPGLSLRNRRRRCPRFGNE